MSRDYERALLEDHALVLCAFIAGVLLLCRSVRFSWMSSLFLLAALLLWCRGFEADLRVGNVNAMQLFVLAVIVFVPRDSVRWILMGALLLFKPNVMFVPLLFAVALFARREYRRLLVDLVYAAAGAAAAFVIASISYGSPRVWLQWIRAANDFYHRLPTRAERNVTPALALYQQHEWLSYVLAALLLVIVCVAIWRAKSDDAPLLVGLGVLVYLLSANVVWLHYMVLVIPIAIALMRWRSTTAVALIALLLVAEEPFELVTRTPAFAHEAALIGVAMFALFACGVWKLSHRDSTAAVR